ncbi:MAG: hypothetical protein ACK5MI_00065 [Mangrovibacterium sp.]
MENHDPFDSNWWDDYFAANKNYKNPNNFKMPTFHHLDIGYRSIKKLASGNTRTWSFSVYNIYNRQNPWIYYKKNEEFKKLSISPSSPRLAMSTIGRAIMEQQKRS